MSLTNDLQKELDLKLANDQELDVGNRDFTVSEAFELFDSFTDNLASNLFNFPDNIPNHLSAGAAALGTAISNTYNHAQANVSSSDLYGLKSQKVVEAIDNSITVSGARAFNSTVSGMAVGIAVEIYNYSQSNSNDLELLNKKIIGVVGSAALGTGLAKTFIALFGGAATAAVSIPLVGLATLAAAVIAGAVANEIIKSDWFDGLYDSTFEHIRELFGWQPTPPRRRDPLILDLDGNGVSVTESAYFDHNANGIANRTEWVSSTDGLLALDRDDNGTIDSGRELFGDNTLNSNGNTASDGYAALKEFDVNNDNIIDQEDKIFDQLKVWVDENSDGISQEHELKKLSSLNIKSIDLTHENLHSQYSDVQGANHSTQSVFVDINNFDRRFVESLDVPDSFSRLPDMRGTGTVRDLHEAMTLSTQLKVQVEQFSTSISREEQLALSEKILFSWAKTSQNYDEHITILSGLEIDKIYAIEAFYGDKVPWSVSFGTNGAAISLPTALINRAYDSLVKMIYFELASQTRLKDYFEAISISADDSGLYLSVSDVLEQFSNRTLNPILIADAMDFVSAMGRTSNSELTGFYTFISNALYGASDSDIEQLHSSLEFNDISILKVEGIKKVIFREGLITFTEGASMIEIIGANGNDQINGTDLADLINANSGNDVVDGGAGDDVITSSDGNAKLFGGAGNDNLMGDTYGNSNKFYGGAGDDVIKLSGNNSSSYVRNQTNRFEGGQGNDNMTGGFSSDVYVFNLGDGHDTISDYGNYKSQLDRIEFGEGLSADNLKADFSGGDLILRFVNEAGVYTGDAITLKGAFTNNSYAIEQFQFADGTVLTHDDVHKRARNIEGTDNDDTITGSQYSDMINAGSGDDVIDGGDGSDVYVFNLGDGHDTIRDYGYYNSQMDRIEFGKELSADKLKADFLGNDMTLRFVDDVGVYTGDAITLKEAFNNNHYGIEQFKFADGTVLIHDEVHLRARNIEGTDNDDTIVGSKYSDVIHAGSGDDVIDGGDGNDVYVFNLGDGHDTIRDYGYYNSQMDRIEFGKGLSADKLKADFLGNDMTLRFVDDVGVYTGDAITLKEAFNNNHYGIEQFKFSDDTILTHDEVHLRARNIEGTDGDDILVGSPYSNVINAVSGDDDIYCVDGNDVIYAGAGNDYIESGDGNDVIYASAGNDYIDSGDGDDVIHAGSGDDDIYIGGGNDVYVFNLGDGHDTITGWSDTIQKGRIKFGEGLRADKLKAEYSFYSRDITLRFIDKSGAYTGDAITLTDNNNYIEQFEFADGTVLTLDDVRLLARNIESTDSDDMLAGSPYSDVIHAGDGNDDIHSGDGNDVIYAGAGNDEIDGGDGDDVIYAGTGNDYICMSGGNDVYVFNLGDGHDTITGWSDTIQKGRIEFGEGLSLDKLKVEFSFNERDITLSFIDQSGSYSGDAITLERCNDNIEQFKFVDGTVLTLDDVRLLARSIEGTDSDDQLSGSPYSDVIHAGAGNDEIDGGDGDDVIYAGTGNDYICMSGGNDVYVFNLGDGHDTVKSWSNAIDKGRIEFGEGLSADKLKVEFSSYNSSVILSFIDQYGDYTGDAITLQHNNNNIEQFKFVDGTVLTLDDIRLQACNTESSGGDDVIYSGAGDDYIYGCDGNDVIYAEAGNDSIDGGNGDDVIHAGAGDDNIYIGGGNDVFVFNLGDGHDTITSWSDTFDKGRIEFGEGLSADKLKVEFSLYDSDITLSFIDKSGNYTGDAITLTDNNNYIEQFEFADGTVLTLGDVRLLARNIEGTDSDDILVGSPYSNVINAGSGDDDIYCGDGNDVIYAGAGNDYIDSGDGDDVIHAGSGNDDIYIGGGNDMYVFNLGDGHDTITDWSDATQKGRIQFGEGLSADKLKVEFSLYDSDMTLSFIDQSGDYTGDAITLTDNNNYIEQFEFADGIVLTLDDVRLLARNIEGTESDDMLAGSPYSDVIHAGAGDDFIDSGDGDDVIYGSTGDDYIVSGYGNNVYVFNQGDGHDTITDYGYHNSQKDRIEFSEGISLSNLSSYRDGDNMILYINGAHSGDSITIVNGYTDDTNFIENIVLDDDTVTSPFDIPEYREAETGLLVQAMSSFDDADSSISTSSIAASFEDKLPQLIVNNQN
ncbi:MAG: calcium-binding protein [Vibrio sp.]